MCSDLKWKKIWIRILFISDLKDFEFWNFSQYSSNVKSHLQKKFQGDLECLQMCRTTCNHIYTGSQAMYHYMVHKTLKTLVNIVEDRLKKWLDFDVCAA